MVGRPGIFLYRPLKKSMPPARVMPPFQDFFPDQINFQIFLTSANLAKIVHKFSMFFQYFSGVLWLIFWVFSNFKIWLYCYTKFRVYFAQGMPGVKLKNTMLNLSHYTMPISYSPVRMSKFRDFLDYPYFFLSG